MSLWRPLARGLRALFHRQDADREIAEEVESYFEETAAGLAAAGMPPDEARRAARAQLGSAAAVREQVRASGWENVIAAPLSEVRYAARRLRGSPGFSAAAILTLALGIGSTTAIFSVIESVLLKPLPYPDSGRIVALRHTAPGIHIDDLNMAASFYYVYRERGRVFQDVAMWTPNTASITGAGDPEEVPGLAVSYRFLAVLGVQPAFGRAFTAADDEPRGQPAIIVSDGYWRSRFGGDRSVLGRRMKVDGGAYEVIGVLPPSFQFMDRQVSFLTTFRMDRSTIRLISFCCQGIARLKPGATLAQANADVARILPMAPPMFPINPGFSANAFAEARIAPRLRTMKDDLVGDIGKTLWVLMATVGIVLVIVCANVANLLLVRAGGRRQELAVRAALGAGWARLARELLLESLLLGVTGGALGLALAYAALRALTSSGLRHFPRIHEVSIDPAALVFALAVSCGAGLLFGLIPVFKYARPEISAALHGGRVLSPSRERHRARSLLVIAQVALALLLMVGSGLMIRTFQALRRVDPGISRPDEVQTLRVSIPDSEAAGSLRAVRLEESMLRAMESVSGAGAAGIIDTLPLDGGSNDPVYAQDRLPPEGSVPPIRRYKFISPGYFSAAGARLIAGRDFTWAETYSQAPVAVISEAMAREFWHDPRNAIGKRIRPTLKDDWREVIGVAANLYDNGIDQPAPTIVYWPLWRRNFESEPDSVMRNASFLIRTRRAGSLALIADLRRAVASVNSNLPLADVQTLGTLYDRSLARTSFTLSLLAISGVMALLIGVVGIYGVISYSVSQRTREVGIRLALGAPLAEVTAAFVRYGLALSGIGAACGLAASFALTRLMKSLLYEVSPADPPTYCAVFLGLVLVAAVASYLPARRAVRIDPVAALRAD